MCIVCQFQETFYDDNGNAINGNLVRNAVYEAATKLTYSFGFTTATFEDGSRLTLQAGGNHIYQLSPLYNEDCI